MFETVTISNWILVLLFAISFGLGAALGSWLSRRVWRGMLNSTLKMWAKEKKFS